MGTTSKPRSHGKNTGLGRSTGKQGYELSGRLWVDAKGETFLSWGRIVLLERIREYGSLNKAAHSMGMGYRHAWDLVDQMNRLSPCPLVVKTTGGLGGGGSLLTPDGEAVIGNFWKIADEFREWISLRDPRLWLPGPKKGARRKKGS